MSKTFNRFANIISDTDAVKINSNSNGSYWSVSYTCIPFLMCNNLPYSIKKQRRRSFWTTSSVKLCHQFAQAGHKLCKTIEAIKHSLMDYIWKSRKLCTLDFSLNYHVDQNLIWSHGSTHDSTYTPALEERKCTVCCHQKPYLVIRSWSSHSNHISISDRVKI